MEEITIPYHLAAPAIICLIGLGAILLFRKKLFPKNKLFWISITVFLILYFLIVGSAAFDDIYYQWSLNRYDLDRDGVFGGAEITPEQNEAMRMLTNDTGRNFSFITGFVCSLIISTVVYITGWVISKLKRP
jgi:hypothetical protein